MLEFSKPYYEKYLKIRNQIANDLNTNKTFEPKKYMPEDMQEEWDKLCFPNKIELSKYEFYDNNIYKKR